MTRAARLALLALAAAAALLALRRGAAPPREDRPPSAPAATASLDRPSVPAAEPRTPARAALLWIAVVSGGAPVEGAQVALIQAGTRQSMAFPTPASGRRAVEGLPRGLYRCRATRPGFLPALADVEVADGQARTVVLELRKGASVTGRAVDRRGLGVAGAWVHAVDPDEGAPVADCLETRTDANGGFRLEGMPPGVFDLRIRHGDYRAARRARLVLSDGADLRLGDVRLEEGGRLAGRVTDEEGAAVSGASIVLSNEEVASAVSGADGRFEVRGLGEGLAAGFATAPGFGTARLAGLRPGARDVEFRLPRTASLAGVVDGVPAGGRFGIRLLRFDSDAADFVPLSFRAFDGGPGASFELPEISPGIYRVAAESPGLEAVDVPEVILAPGERRTDLRVRLRPASPPR